MSVCCVIVLALMTAIGAPAHASPRLRMPANDGFVPADDPPTVLEGDKPNTERFSVYFAPLSTATTVNWLTQTNPVLQGGDPDFVPAGGTIDLPAGATSMRFAIRILGDEIVECDEILHVTLDGLYWPDGAPVIMPVLIRDDDKPLCIPRIGFKWR